MIWSRFVKGIPLSLKYYEPSALQPDIFEPVDVNIAFCGHSLERAIFWALGTMAGRKDVSDVSAAIAGYL